MKTKQFLHRNKINKNLEYNKVTKCYITNSLLPLVPIHETKFYIKKTKNKGVYKIDIGHVLDLNYSLFPYIQEVILPQVQELEMYLKVTFVDYYLPSYTSEFKFTSNSLWKNKIKEYADDCNRFLDWKRYGTKEITEEESLFLVIKSESEINWVNKTLLVHKTYNQTLEENSGVLSWRTHPPINSQRQVRVIIIYSEST